MKRELTFADQARKIQKEYQNPDGSKRDDMISLNTLKHKLDILEQQQEAVRAQMNLIEPQQMAAWGGTGGYVNQPDNNLLAMGGMIKRADGSYSKRGLWDNIRANKGSGKKPTKQMLEQEKKIKAEYAMGGEIESAIAPAFFSHGGGIHIDPSKKGTFTAAATKHGKSVQGFASQVLANKENYSPAMVKKANFARNAAKFKHAYGGPMGMYFDGTGKGYNGVIPSEETINKWNQMYPENWSSMSDEEAQPINQIMNEGLLKKYPSSSFTRNLTIPDLKYQPTQPTKPTLNKPFIRYPEQELTIPNLSYKPNTGNSPFYNKYRSLIGTGTNMNNSKESEEPKKPKQKFDAGDLAYLGNLASPLIQLFGTKKQPYDYQRVSPELVKYNPNTTADLVRRGSSLPMYSIKQLGLSPANYLNMIGSISGKAGENIGQANLEGQMKEQIANAGIKNETNRYNAEVQRLQQEAAAKEYAGRLKSYVTGAQGLSNTLSQYVLDKRAGKESEENKQLMKDYTDKHFSYLDKQLEAMKPKSIYDYNSSSTLPSSTLPVSPTFKRSIPTNLEFNLPKSKYGLFK